MSDGRRQPYGDGPPTGVDMASFVTEVKATVLAQVGAERGRASRDRLAAQAVVSTTAARPPATARARASARAAVGDGATVPLRASSRRPERNAFLALAGIAAIVVLVVVAGMSLLGVGAWHRGVGGVASTGGESVASSPTSASSGAIDESAAIAIARASGNTAKTAPAEARMMTYLAWATQYDTGVSAEIEPLQSVWVVSVDGPTTFPGLGSPGSTVPPSDGFTVLIDADTGAVLEFGAHPTAF